MPLTKRRAMKDAAVKLRGEARRTASILHQTPGWRWRRTLCLTERSQQCQSGPTTKAWRRLPARHRHDACETPSEHLRGAVPKLERNACQRGNVGRMRGIVRGTCGGALPKLHGNGRRVRVAPPGACGLHRRKEIHAGVDSIVSKDMRARRSLRRSECGWHRQTALSERVRVAPPGTPGTSADSPIEAGPSYRSCTASPQRRRGVTVSSLIETICEL